MRNWALLFLVSLIAYPSFSIDHVASTRVSVEKFEKILLDNKSKTDSEIAKQLAGIELNERLLVSADVPLLAEAWSGAIERLVLGLHAPGQL